MPRPFPEYPTNVQADNPYDGLDRGLFIYHRLNQYARIKEAEWSSVGPAASPGVLRFKVEVFDQPPVTSADFETGTLLTPPEGEWFDCITRALVSRPIVAEYWATQSMLNWYKIDGASNLDPAEIQSAVNQGQQFISKIGQALGITQLETKILYKVAPGKPLQTESIELKLGYTHNGQHNDRTFTEFPVGFSDPFAFAVEFIKNLGNQS